MASDPKSTSPGTAPSPTMRVENKGIRVFTYPKVIFMFPTLIVAVICGIGMWIIGGTSPDPSKPQVVQTASATDGTPAAATVPATVARHERFNQPQNLFG